jgi:ribose 5-phosphate isomerase B
MKIAIASTRAGLALKDELIAFLRGLGHEADDLGMKTGGDFVPYYESAARVAAGVSRGDYPRGIAVCGTGAGSAIVANKFRNVYCVQASSEYEGRRATVINNANVLALGEWITPPQHAKDIVKAWLNAQFGEGFESSWQEFLKNACAEVAKIEAKNFA